MSYMKDIDEYSEDALLTELRLRAERRSRGVCDYCNRPPDTPSCKFPNRHRVGLGDEQMRQRIGQYEAAMSAFDHILFGSGPRRSRDDLETKMYELKKAEKLRPAVDEAIVLMEDAAGVPIKQAWSTLDQALRKLKDARG